LIEFHDIANIFPMMGVEEFEQLKQDIKSNGLIEPINTYEGKILDGRNRWLACGEVGIEPRFETYQGDEPVSFVISKNLKRRHLNGSQKAMIATEIKPALEEEARKRQAHGMTAPGKTLVEQIPEASDGRARDKAGEVIGISGRYVAEAEKIKQEAPEYVQPIMDGEMTITKAKREINRKERVEKIVESTAQPIEGIGKFPVIYADPPWRYDFSKSTSRDIENQYPTMDIDDICELNVQAIANDDCVLFIWATNPKLIEALRVIESWGFEYKTNMVWVKDKIGMGYYARQQHELLLIATKGALPVSEPGNRVSSVIEAKRGEHSKKPDCVYEIIERMYPDYSKVELFARGNRVGWEVWGNQV
jgi:N6-adenosine-specific RNA methylase IME4